jgi:predicted transcriptional regulator
MRCEPSLSTGSSSFEIEGMSIGVKINITLLSDRLHCLGSVLGKGDRKLCYKKMAHVVIVYTNKKASQDTLMSSVPSLNHVNPKTLHV